MLRKFLALYSFLIVCFTCTMYFINKTFTEPVSPHYSAGQFVANIRSQQAKMRRPKPMDQNIATRKAPFSPPRSTFQPRPSYLNTKNSLNKKLGSAPFPQTQWSPKAYMGLPKNDAPKKVTDYALRGPGPEWGGDNDSLGLDSHTRPREEFGEPQRKRSPMEDGYEAPNRPMANQKRLPNGYPNRQPSPNSRRPSPNSRPLQADPYGYPDAGHQEPPYDEGGRYGPDGTSYEFSQPNPYPPPRNPPAVERGHAPDSDLPFPSVFWDDFDDDF